MFRKADVNDAKEIADLINSAYRGDSSKEGWTTEADMVDGLRVDKDEIAAIIQEEDNEFIVAQDSRGIIGCIHIKKENHSTLYFGLFAVNPKIQAQGIGKKLMSEAETRARDWKLNKIRITVINIRTDISSYYERFGFKRTGVEEQFPSPHLLKISDVKLVEMIKVLEEKV